jgi:acetylornithine deacetylase
MRDELVDLLTRLVAIDSVNPALVAGGAGEGAIAGSIAGWAQAAQLEATVTDGIPGRPSVVVRAPGSGGGRTLLLCGHTDTVGVEGMDAPFTARVEGDRLYGRGAYDMKAGLAAALIACREAAGLGLRGDVVVAAVADEEHASLGVQEVLQLVQADGAIVTEPTELELVVAHKGFVWVELEVTGRAAHGSRPHLGVDAIVKTGPILVALAELEASRAERSHPLLGRGSLHASTVHGGSELSSYPARCVLQLERRTLPGETASDVEAEIEGVLERCRASDPELVVEQRTLLARDPLEVDPGHELVSALRASLDPFPARISGASYWADSGLLAAAGIPTVLFGPRGEGAHAREEWVSIGDTVFVANTLVDAARRFCA